MDLDLTGVSDFLVLLEEGHYGPAAVRQHMSPSGLSKRIQRLERQLGVRLLERDAAGLVGPTAAGARFARDAGPLLAAARAARAAARAVDTPSVLRLGIVGGVDPAAFRWLLTAVRRQLFEAYPGARVLCVPQPIPAVHSGLTDNHVDVMLGVLGDVPCTLTAAPTGPATRVAILPAHHVLADADHVSAGDLVDMPMVCDPTVPREWMAPFVLGDIRATRGARLVETQLPRASRAFSAVLTGKATITALPCTTTRLDPRLRAVPLTDVPPVQTFTSRRSKDQREPVVALHDIVSRVFSAQAVETTRKAPVPARP